MMMKMEDEQKELKEKIKNANNDEEILAILMEVAESEFNRGFETGCETGIID